MKIDNTPTIVCRTSGDIGARTFYVLGLELPEYTLRKYLRRIVLHPNSCWIWVGARNSTGYGNLRLNKKYTLAHRLFYELFVGVITKPDIRHSCDRPACVNPVHLIEGTRGDNMQDMARRGRSSLKLREDVILEIQTLASSGMKIHDIAQEVGVGLTAVRTYTMRSNDGKDEE